MEMLDSVPKDVSSIIAFRIVNTLQTRRESRLTSTGSAASVRFEPDSRDIVIIFVDF